MSSAMVVYSIPLARMSQLLGSRDREVLEEILREDAGFLEEIDELFAEDADDPLPMQNAIEHLLDGGPYLEHCEPVYLYAFEALCRSIGSAPDNRAFQPPIRWGYITFVDRYLESIAFPLRVSDLAGGGWPFPIPDGDDPSGGHWPRDNYEKALAQLIALRLDGVEVNLAEALASILGWLDCALENPDDFLVGIYC